MTGERDKLQTALDEAKASLTAVTGERDTLQTALDEANALITTLTEENETLKNTLEENGQAYTEMEQELTGLRAQITDLLDAAKSTDSTATLQPLFNELGEALKKP